MDMEVEQKVPAAIEGARAELEAWRAQRRRGQRIPSRVWRSAVRAASHHGVHQVSRALGLDYVRLKRRVVQASTADGSGVEATFVELGSGQPAGDNVGCIVELEKGNGTRMRICVRDGAVVDWCRMKEAFLGA
jgi:hypothetical protein